MFRRVLPLSLCLVASPVWAQFAPLPESQSDAQLSSSEGVPSLAPSLATSSEVTPEASVSLRATRPTFAVRCEKTAPIPAISDSFGQTPGDVEPWMFAVARARPDRVRLWNLGRSSGGRTIWALEIRPLQPAPNPKRLAVICRQHGNEPEATASGVRFAAQFLAVSTPQAKAISQKIALLIVPIANPDGSARYQRRTLKNIDMNRDWGHNRSPEVRALTQMVQKWKPQLLVDNHQWLPFERMPPPMAEASGGQLARQSAQTMSQSNARRGFTLAARSRWGLDSLCHRFWGQRFGVPAILLETRHQPRVAGARQKAIAQALLALWGATQTLARS